MHTIDHSTAWYTSYTNHRAYDSTIDRLNKKLFINNKKNTSLFILEDYFAKNQIICVINALDAIYIQDAYDNSSYNSFNDDGTHDASSAEVFLGTPRYFNAGLKINF